MKANFNVPDVSCGHCKSSIEGALQPLPGVEQAEVDLEAKSVEVVYDDNIIDRSGVVRAIESSGYAVAG